MSKYYVEVDSYWQNSQSLFIGPFLSEEQAERYTENSNAVRYDHTARNVRHNIRYQIRNTTQARRAGMNEQNTLPTNTVAMPNDTADLTRLQNEM